MKQEKTILRTLRKNRGLYRLNLAADGLIIVCGIVILILSLIAMPAMKWYFPLSLTLVYVIHAVIMYLSQKKYAFAAGEIKKAIKDKIEDAQDTYSAKTQHLREQVQQNKLRSVFYCIITGFLLVATWVFATWYLFQSSKLDGNTRTVALILGILVLAFTIPDLLLFFHFLKEKRNREQAAAVSVPAVTDVPADKILDTATDTTPHPITDTDYPISDEEIVTESKPDPGFLTPEVSENDEKTVSSLSE